MAIPNINPQPAAGFRAVDLNDCEPKCKCFWGENKGRPYYRDQPCIVKDGFEEDTCTCPFYPTGVVFSSQYPASDRCYAGKISGLCCCGYYSVNLGGADDCGNLYTIPCEECQCPIELTPCKDGCVERIRIGSPGVIASYKQPVRVGRAGERKCNTLCPPRSAGCSYRKTWNALLGTSVKYVILATSFVPFYTLIDATTTDGVAGALADCCPEGEFDVYGNCRIDQTEFTTCDWSFLSGGVPQDVGLSNSVMMEATLIMSGEEVDVVFLTIGSYSNGHSGKSSTCFKFVAAELSLRNGQGGFRTEFITGSPETIAAAERRGACGSEDCPGGLPCPDKKKDCPDAAPTCKRSISFWGGDEYTQIWDKYRYQGSCRGI